MLRSATNNYRTVGVITDPSDYAANLTELAENGGQLTLKTKEKLAVNAFQKTAGYDQAIAAFLGQKLGKTSNTSFVKLRYGENPHQDAVYHGKPYDQLHGKELSFNNIIDIDAAQNIVADFDMPAIAIIKHTNPCGAAIGKDLVEAYNKALACDPASAYGSIVGANKTVTKELAEKVAALFVEAIVAPDYDQEALKKLQEKKNIRIIKTDFTIEGNDTKRTNMGYLIQARDTMNTKAKDLAVKTKAKPSSVDELLFAWKICRHVKSNAIVLTKNGATIGVGAGQMSRIDALNCAIRKAQEHNPGQLKDCVLASDAFFPFRDTVDQAHAVGVKEIIQPGGSMRDQESIDACNEHGIAMVFTGRRHFKH
jgi:phosphoribosylaminoimidazolecarboxamide formyltransferase/IMP cyclohydrolase